MYTYVYVHIHIYVYTHVYTHTDRNGEMAPFLWRTLTNTVAGNCFFFHCLLFFFNFLPQLNCEFPKVRANPLYFFSVSHNI